MTATLTTTTTDYPTLARLTERRDPMIGRNTYLARLRGESVAVCLHRTNILVVNPDGTIKLNSGGYRTVTTKDRMNQFLRPLGANVHQKQGDWYLRTPDGDVHAFYDHMTLGDDGNVIDAF